ncbi:hypothetical protein ACSAZL_07420 [Methanosarcina sp. T3]|uniref:hypothetical protein n=1 Tax=Methanosarcina sp. T3 TaxID=3439062 RepID=UPI003F87CE22
MVETTSFSNFLETVGVLAILVFVLTSMFGMGFSLTVQQILTPLSDGRLAILHWQPISYWSRCSLSGFC